MFVIDTQSKLPIFEQLKKQILEFITIGILSPNDKLPSVRAMASQIGVNPNTVAKAYQELEEHIRRKERDALWQTMNPIS